MRDAIVVIGVVALTAAIVLAVIRKSSDEKNRIQCADNLRKIGEALHRYSNENKGFYPRTRYDMDSADRVTVFTNPMAADPFAPDGPEANDATAGLYLLIRVYSMEPSTFVCPSTDARPLTVDGGKPASSISNFSSVAHLSYSYLNPYAGPTGVSAGFKPMPASPLVIAADLNPGGKSVASVRFDQMPLPELPRMEYLSRTEGEEKFTDAQRAANSSNHRGFGQNVLEAGGGVRWQPTPFLRARDNIYTRDLAAVDPKEHGDPIMGPPMTMTDTVLLPTAPAAK